MRISNVDMICSIKFLVTRLAPLLLSHYVMRRIIILDRIRIRIIFVFQNQPNTNTNNIRFSKSNEYKYE